MTAAANDDELAELTAASLVRVDDLYAHRSEQDRIQPALSWIVAELARYRIPYQVVGGLAVRAWGGSREVVDIDLYAPLEQAAGLLAGIAAHLVWGPAHHRDSSWDLTFAKIDFNGQRIEIGDTSKTPRFFNVVDGRWEEQIVDYSAGTRRSLFGVEFNVMPKSELIHYKAALNRPIDRIDVEDLRA